jgi:hypothetical protein
MEPNRPAIFREEQRFAQPWLWALLLGGLAVSLATAYPLVVKLQQRACPVPLSVWLSLAFPSAFMLLIVSLFALTRMATEVRPEGIAVSFRPLQFRPKLIPYTDIVRHEAVAYRPILEYGGWGIRRGRNGYAYNVSGNRGLLLTLKGGKTFLIGSQQPERLKAAVDSAMRNR